MSTTTEYLLADMLAHIAEMSREEESDAAWRARYAAERLFLARQQSGSEPDEMMLPSFQDPGGKSYYMPPQRSGKGELADWIEPAKRKALETFSAIMPEEERDFLAALDTFIAAMPEGACMTQAPPHINARDAARHAFYECDGDNDASITAALDAYEAARQQQPVADWIASARKKAHEIVRLRWADYDSKDGVAHDIDAALDSFIAAMPSALPIPLADPSPEEVPMEMTPEMALAMRKAGQPLLGTWISVDICSEMFPAALSAAPRIIPRERVLSADQAITAQKSAMAAYTLATVKKGMNHADALLEVWKLAVASEGARK